MVDFGPKLTEDRLSEILKECDYGESTAPGSTLSIYTDDDRDTESDIYSSSWNFLEEDGHGAEATLNREKSIGFPLEQGKDAILDSRYFTKHNISLLNDRFRPEKGSHILPEVFPSGQGRSFLPINSVPGQLGQRPRAPSPGISTMMSSLVDHPQERPCTPTASTLYKNTVTHRNPSWLGQCTFEECMEFTQWINDFFKYSRVETRVDDLARDLGDGITLLDFVQVLVGTPPPQVHVKPALAVQKLENIHVCLQFLARNGVAIQDLTAEDIVEGNLKVVLALCHCLRRHFGSASGPVLLVKNPRPVQQQHGYPTTISYQPLISSVCVDSDFPGCSSDAAALKSSRSVQQQHGYPTTKSYQPLISNVCFDSDFPGCSLDSAALKSPPSVQQQLGYPTTKSYQPLISSVCFDSDFPGCSLDSAALKSPPSVQQQHGYPTTKSYQPLISSVCCDSDSPGCSSDSAALNSRRSVQQQHGYPTTKSYQPLISSVCFDSDSPGCSSDSAALNAGDVAILSWVGSVISDELVDFKVLQSGTVLCLLLNKIAEGSIPDVVIKYGLPSEKISLALQVSRKDFGVLSNLSTDDVLKGRSTVKLSNYLRSLQRQFLRRNPQREYRNVTQDQRGGQPFTRFDLSVEENPPALDSSSFGIEHLTAAKPSKISTKQQLSKSKEKLAQLNRELKLLKMAISEETGCAVPSLKDSFDSDASNCLGESSYFANLSFECEYSKAKSPGDSRNKGPISTYSCLENENTTFECRAALSNTRDGLSRSPSSPYARFENVKSWFYPNSTYPPSDARQPNITRPAKDTLSREQRLTPVLVNSGGETYSTSNNRASAKLDFTPKQPFASSKKVLKELNALKRAPETVKRRDVEITHCRMPAGSRHDNRTPETSGNETVNSQRRQSEQTLLENMSSRLHSMTALARRGSKKANAVSY